MISSTVRLAGATDPWVGLGVVRDDQGGLVERDAACPVPGAVVDVPGVSEHARPVWPNTLQAAVAASLSMTPAPR
jgi:hypothetical protein